jgi:hypothetical protein
MLGLLAACSAGVSAGQVPTSEATSDATDEQPLGLNDVSILLPLPGGIGSPVLAAAASPGAPLIERGWFDALVADRADIAPRTGGAIALADYQIVAARFDLCDRAVIGPCPADATGRLRLVLQPLYLRAGGTFAHDIALHAFYPIPAADMTDVVGDLRRLARLRNAPRDAPLSVGPAGAGAARYLEALRGLVLRYARATNLVRLTVIGQIADSAAFAWIFRGIDRDGDELVSMVIPGIAATQQTVQLAGGDTVYRSEPIADVPAGFALATSGPRFRAATPAEQARSLAALIELQDPTLHDTMDTQCIGCHLATYLTARRAAIIPPSALPGGAAASGARAVHTIASEDPRVVRAFGWAGNAPAISQRVVNETAQVLSEIEARFPPRRGSSAR